MVEPSLISCAGVYSFMIITDLQMPSERRLRVRTTKRSIICTWREGVRYILDPVYNSSRGHTLRHLDRPRPDL